MKTIRNLGILAVCVAAIGVPSFAGAQSVRHDVMDAKAARRDIRRLTRELIQARAAHNWGKVKQDKRLIAADQRFLHKDWRKVANSG